MFGDVLKSRITELSDTQFSRRKDMSSFWFCLQDIIINEINNYNGKIDSNLAIEIYYNILKSNEHLLPDFAKCRLNNGQERYRVCNRNLWSSNAWHATGLEGVSTITTTLSINIDRKGNKRTYLGRKQ